MPTEREYEVVESLTTAYFFRVRARNQAEAIEKVKNDEHHDVWQGDLFPNPHRRMTARRVD